MILTDIPPCDDFTAGLVISAMVRFLPRGSVCCFAVVNPTLPMRMSAEFGNIPVEFHSKPSENWTWLPQRRILGKAAAVVSLLGERLTERLQVKPLIDRAVAFGKEQQVDRVWAVLQGQTMIRMALPVAEGLGVPLHTHVWDPFSWWAKANRLDGPTTRRVQATFDRTIAASKAVATASKPMADLYGEKFGVRSIPVISSHPEALAQRPRPETDQNDVLLIGMAGQFYSASEWLCLLRALHAAKWTVAGRPVKLVVLGPQRPPGMDEDRIRFLGWKTQAQAAEILSCCDLLYCPYPFDPAMKEVSQLSFPSKLVLYLAAGRPVIFHGPSYSSPAHYIKDKQCGRIADRLIASSPFNEIERFATDPVLYRQAALAAQSAFREDFTLASMQRSFLDFIDHAPPPDGVLVHDHTALAIAPPAELQLSETIRNRQLSMLALRVGRKARAAARRTKGRATRFTTELALRIPRLRALKQEIHFLYAEIASLQQQLAESERKLTTLMSEQIRPSDMPLTNPLENVALMAHAYRGQRPLFLGRRDLVEKVPLLAGTGMDHTAVGEFDDPALLVDLEERVVTHLVLPSVGAPTATEHARVDGSDKWPAAGLLRTVLHYRVDALVVAVDELTDVRVQTVTHVAELLGLPVTIAAMSGISSASAEPVSGRVTVIPLLQNDAKPCV